jgi:hypothetical protein
LRVSAASSTRASQAPSPVGLANTRARLARLYGDAAAPEVGDAPDGGLEVRVTLPFRSAAPAAAP